MWSCDHVIMWSLTIPFFFTVPEIATPPLLGNILPGVTRDSLIALAKEWVMTLFVENTFVALNNFEQTLVQEVN